MKGSQNQVNVKSQYSRGHPNPEKITDGPPKAKNNPKIISKLKYRVEGSLENKDKPDPKSLENINKVDPKSIFEP